jgi:phosphomannomutase
MKKIDPYIFRAYDIRGIYKKNLDESLMLRIGYVLGKENQKFVVGCDVRESGHKLAKALIKGLDARKAKVFYTGKTSFGQTLFAGRELKARRTIFITASHLPPEWNGLKIFYGNGVAIPEKEILSLRDKVIKLNLSKIKFSKTPKFQKIGAKKIYSDYFVDKFSSLKNNKLKVVVDCGNGATCLSAPQIFRKLGFQVSELYCNADSSFPGRGGEPTKKTVKVLQKKVKTEKANFGVAFDGDGDRAVIIDDKGRYLSGNEVGIILAKHILRDVTKDKKKIIITVSCSMAFEKELNPLGIKTIRMPVGHTFLIQGCNEHKAILGIEESNHTVITQYFLFDDALLVPMKIAEIILEQDKKLSEMVDEITIYPFEEIRFDCPDAIKFNIIKKLAKDFSKEYKNVNLIDGIKVNFDYGWILIRVSNTAPVVRLYVEAINQKRFNELKQKFLKILKNTIK